MDKKFFETEFIYKKFGIKAFIMFRLPSNFRTEEDYNKNFLELINNTCICSINLRDKRKKKNRNLDKFLEYLFEKLNEENSVYKKFIKYCSINFEFDNIYIQNIEKHIPNILRKQIHYIIFEECVIGKNNQFSFFNDSKYFSFFNSTITDMNVFSNTNITSMFFRKCYIGYNLEAISTMHKLKTLEFENTNLSDKIQSFFTFTKVPLKELTLIKVGKINISSLLVFKNTLKSLNLAGSEVYNLEIVKELILTELYVPPKLIGNNINPYKVIQQAKLLEKLLLKDNYNFLDFINKRNIPIDIKQEILNHSNIIIFSAEEYYKKSLENAKQYDEKEIVDWTGHSYTTPF